ncbi:MAG TPA: DNA helicase RecG, partial [Megasphaera sp.]|nr:DNA helicase RecG [Megasphaera sp.]
MDSSIRRLPGIGVRREKLFARLGVTTIPALLQYFPRDYEDRSHVVPIGRADLERKEPVLVCGRVGTIQEIRPRRGMTILKVVLHDETGAVEMTWFNQSFKKKQFHTGMTVSAFGRIEWNYGRRQMNTPDVEDGEPQGQGFMPL